MTSQMASIVFFVWMFLRLCAFRMWAILCSLNFRAAFKFVILETDFLSPHLYSAFGFCFFKKEEILSVFIFKSKQSHFFPLHDFFDSHRNFHLHRQRPRRPLFRPPPSDSSTPSSSPKSPQHQFLCLIRYYYWNANFKDEKVWLKSSPLNDSSSSPRLLLLMRRMALKNVGRRRGRNEGRYPLVPQPRQTLRSQRAPVATNLFLSESESNPMVLPRMSSMCT